MTEKPESLASLMLVPRTVRRVPAVSVDVSFHFLATRILRSAHSLAPSLVRKGKRERWRSAATGPVGRGGVVPPGGHRQSHRNMWARTVSDGRHARRGHRFVSVSSPCRTPETRGMLYVHCSWKIKGWYEANRCPPPQSLRPTPPWRPPRAWAGFVPAAKHLCFPARPVSASPKHLRPLHCRSLLSHPLLFTFSFISAS